MKLALVIVESGTTDTQQAVLRHFSDHVEASAARSRVKIERLNAGAFLVPLDSGLLGLTILVSQAESVKLSIRTLFFDQAPPFVITKPA